ncbi:hypothetical protein AB0M28_04765 [Streptomyces sp. NPDC051940]|uniref:hypothetical protein n=1 Tax=Streptomyces sp. NPDC051940 TaxID=3155675 RepID=UPI00341B49F4
MGAFVEAAFAFPAVVFSFALIVVVAYWLFAAISGGLGEVLDAEAPGDVAADAGGDAGGFFGLTAALGLGGIPLTVAVSLVIAVAWFVSLTAVVLIDGLGLGGLLAWMAGVAGLVAASVAGWGATWLVARPLRRLTGSAPAASRFDFVGLVCTVRTGAVGPDFGQAEVTAGDGSSAIVQVRAEPDTGLAAGASALIFDYDAEGEFFRIAPFEL